MDDVTILITGAGAPGIMGTLYSLKKNFDNRRIKTIGIDIQDDVIGQYECDAFYKVPQPEQLSFIETLLEICENENVSVILPQVTRELRILADKIDLFSKIGTKIAISNKQTIDLVNDKFKLLNLAKQIGLPVPKYKLVSNWNDLVERVMSMGYPEKKIVIKPPISNGMRGLRILDEKIDRIHMFYNEKPTSIYTRLNELQNILEGEFPPLIVTEYLPGDEYSVDLLRTNEKTVVIPRKRDKIRSGITFGGTIIENQRIIDYSTRLAEASDLQFAFGFQFKMNSEGEPILLESNPRIQGTMVMSTLANANIIYQAVKMALGEQLPKMEIFWGTKMLRYWGGLGIYNNVKGGKI